MKTKLTFLFIACLSFFVLSPKSYALPTTTTTTATPIEAEKQSFKEGFKDYVSKKKAQRKQRLLKVMAKAKKFAQKLDIDLEDETMKWLWYAIFAYGASILIYLVSIFTFSGLGWISALCSLLASVCFVIWLLKYLELA